MGSRGELTRDDKVLATLPAAQLYYLRDKTMDVIARKPGTSRAPRSPVS